MYLGIDEGFSPFLQNPKNVLFNPAGTIIINLSLFFLHENCGDVAGACTEEGVPLWKVQCIMANCHMGTPCGQTDTHN